MLVAVHGSILVVALGSMLVAVLGSMLVAVLDWHIAPYWLCPVLAVPRNQLPIGECNSPVYVVWRRRGPNSALDNSPIY